MRTLILDNYDSFTFNLFQAIGELDERPTVLRNDAADLAQIRALAPDRIVISPGPGRPDDPAYFGVCAQVIQELGPSTPILGVCLGHQGIAHVLGGSVVRAGRVMHGKTSVVEHDGSPFFAGIPKRFEAMRYHSLVVDAADVPDVLTVTARTDDGVIMALRHERWPVYGVQFHPESIGTLVGPRLLYNFLRNPG